MVILGLLSTEPMSGYELKAAIDRTVGHFWSESYGQIYPTLKRLLEQGLLSCEDAPTGERRRQVYQATEAGRAALATWLVEPPQAQAMRNELLLKIFFGHYAPPGALQAHLGQCLAASRRGAVMAAGIAAQLQAEESDTEDLRYWLLTLDLGRRVAQARAEWAEHALQMLSEARHDD